MARREELLQKIEDGLSSGAFNDRQKALIEKVRESGLLTKAPPAPFDPQAEASRARGMSGGFLFS